jgi:4-amino-4-deoxy-L-arabinose transferase-like glycosyltransferase
MRLSLLERRYITPGLLLLNMLTAAISFTLAYNSDFSDEHGYRLMSEGLSQGRFSSWYFLDHYYPETLRTPAYPIFLFLVGYISNAKLWICLIQLVLYFVGLGLACDLVSRLSGRDTRARIFFLILTAINIQIPYYAGCVSPDFFCILLTILYAYILILKSHQLKYACLAGVVAGMICMMRPSFLLFPFLITGYFLFKRLGWRYTVLHVVLFTTTLLPFSLWNYFNHGVFKPTPLEGGAGVAHMGYWSFRLPRNYTEHYYWHNTTEHDLMDPFAFSAEERESNRLIFEQEWKEILIKLDARNSPEDRVEIERMTRYNPYAFKLYNSDYTKDREKLLWMKTLEHIWDNPWFYFKTRVYSFCRFYFTGVSYNKWNSAASILGKIKTLYPFLITFTCIFIGFVVGIISAVRSRTPGTFILCAMALYQGVIHVPFAIQARYTVPVHFTILILLALAVSHIFASEGIDRSRLKERDK